MILRLWSRQRGGNGAAVLPPVEGGLADWPAYLVNAFNILDAAAWRIEDARRRQREAAAAAAARGKRRGRG